MIEDETTAVDPAIAHEIEDAIMFGKPGDIRALLENMGEGTLPEDLRNSLESLHYFRTHYGDRPAASEMDKKKITLMDAAWAMELLNKLRARVSAAEKLA